jgi:hypothetical protein
VVKWGNGLRRVVLALQPRQGVNAPLLAMVLLSCLRARHSGLHVVTALSLAIKII